MTTTLLAYFPSPPRGAWHLGPLPIRAYALCIIVGIVAALIIGDRRWAARGGERGVIYDIALWAVPFGLVGGRVYHLITDWRTYFGPTGAGADAALRIWDGGLGIWGAVALGGVGAWIGCRRRGIPLPAFGDAIAPGIVLAQAIGRLGNYFNQELYGRETTVPWGMEIFYRRDPSGIVDVHSLDGVSTGQVALVVQPTFLYELLWNVLIFVALIYLDRRFQLGHGRLFALYAAGYCVGRFCIELLRADPATLIDGIRVNSFTSTFVFIGAVVYMVLAPKGREDPAALRATWAAEEPAEEPEEEPAEEPEEELASVASTSGTAALAAAPELADAAEDAEPEDEGAPEAEAERAEVAASEGDEPSAAEETLEDSAEAAEAEESAEPEEEAVADAEAEAGEEAEGRAAVSEAVESAEPEEEEVGPEADAEPAGEVEPESPEAAEVVSDEEEAPAEAVEAAEAAEAVEEPAEPAEETVPDAEAEASVGATAKEVDSEGEESIEPEDEEAPEPNAEPAEEVEPESAEADEAEDVDAEVQESAEPEEEPEEQEAADTDAETTAEAAVDASSDDDEPDAASAAPADESPQPRRRWWRRPKRP